MDRKDQQLRLRNGKLVTIRHLSKKDTPEELMHYINQLIEEEIYLLINRKATLKDEINFRKKKLQAARNGDAITLVARDGKIVGICNAERGSYKQRDNILLGISIHKEYRRLGLGELMFRKLIALVRKMRPRNVYLHVYSPNRPAIALYEKLGFRKIAVLPAWTLHKGKYLDNHIMVLKKG